MKKVCLLALALSLMVIPAIGEDLDLSTLSLDELQSLHKRLDAEITERNACEINEPYTGTLIGGKNIEPGPYVFRSVGQAEVITYTNEEAMVNRDIISGITCDDGVCVTVYIDSGSVVFIRGLVRIEKATADWTPTESE